MYSKSRMFWKVRAMPSVATWCGLAPVISRSWKMTRPVVGGKMPVIPLKSVVFPAPFGPMRAKISPFLTSNVTSSTATSPPKRFVTWSMRRMGGAVSTVMSSPP